MIIITKKRCETCKKVKDIKEFETGKFIALQCIECREISKETRW